MQLTCMAYTCGPTKFAPLTFYCICFVTYPSILLFNLVVLSWGRSRPSGNFGHCLRAFLVVQPNALGIQWAEYPTLRRAGPATKDHPAPSFKSAVAEDPARISLILDAFEERERPPVERRHCLRVLLGSLPSQLLRAPSRPPHF